MTDVKKVLRSFLVYAPWVQDLRFRGQASLLRALRKPFCAEFAGLRALRTRDPLILDIGCNRGIALSTMLSMKPDARIVGFEANPDVAASTAAQYAGDRRVEIRAVGLGERPSEHTLHVPVYRGYRFDGLGSFDPWLAQALFDGRLLYWFDAKRFVVEQKRVVVQTLDSHRLDPTVIKMYVQGHETAVIAGAQETLRRCEPIVMAPSQTPAIDESLRALGYRRYQWNGERFEAEADFGYVVYYMTPARARDVGA